MTRTIAYIVRLFFWATVTFSVAQWSAFAQNRATQPAGITSDDVQKVLDAHRKAEELRRAIAIAESVAKQLGALVTQIPTGDSVRGAFVRESGEARQHASRVARLESSQESFRTNGGIFAGWEFALSEGTALDRLLPDRLRKIQEQNSQDMRLANVTPTIVDRFSRLFTELNTAVTQTQAPRFKLEFDRKAKELDKKFRDESNKLFGSERWPNFTQNFTPPSKELVDGFKANMVQIFSDYDKALDSVINSSDLQTLHQDVRNKLLQAAPQLVNELRGELERAATAADVTQRDNKFLSTSLFLGLTAAFVVVIAMLLFVPRTYSADVQPLVFRSPFFLQLFTVYVLSSSIIILALGSYLDGNNLATLLAGISGYVLGQLGKDSAGGPIAHAEAGVARRPATQMASRRVDPTRRSSRKGK
jgi:hypothetical protein